MLMSNGELAKSLHLDRPLLSPNRAGRNLKLYNWKARSLKLQHSKQDGFGRLHERQGGIVLVAVILKPCWKILTVAVGSKICIGYRGSFPKKSLMPCPCAPPPVQITHVNDHFTNSHSRPGEKQFAPQQPSAGGEGERGTSTFEKDCEQFGKRNHSNDNNNNDDSKL